jgi:N-acetylneuraminic acid mutarotase
VKKIILIIIGMFSFISAQTVPNLPIPICAGTAEVINNSIYFFGGGSRWYLSATRYQAIYKYDGNNWIVYDSIPDDNTWGMESVVIDNDVYLFAGHRFGARNVRKYNVPSKTWTYLNLSPNLLTFGSTFVYANNHIYLLQRSGNVYEYDLLNDTWQIKTPNSIPGYSLSSAVYQDEIYVIGFYDSTFSHPFYKYTPATDSWNQLATIPYQVTKCAMEVIGDKIYCAGGSFQGNPSERYDSLLVYDIVSDTWTIDQFELSSKRVWMADAFYNNSFYVLGGLDTTGFATDIVEEIIPMGPITGFNEAGLTSKDFYLKQNYPNPFNPTTRIKYAVNDRQFITIKAYDILGNEVAILVNEEKSSGTYEVEFDGTGLSSGIYFCKLQTNDFIITRKMLLLK